MKPGWLLFCLHAKRLAGALYAPYRRKRANLAALSIVCVGGERVCFVRLELFMSVCLKSAGRFTAISEGSAALLFLLPDRKFPQRLSAPPSSPLRLIHMWETQPHLSAVVG